VVTAEDGGELDGDVEGTLDVVDWLLDEETTPLLLEA